MIKTHAHTYIYTHKYVCVPNEILNDKALTNFMICLHSLKPTREAIVARQRIQICLELSRKIADCGHRITRVPTVSFQSEL